jgi:hypothetical protein
LRAGEQKSQPTHMGSQEAMLNKCLQVKLN